MKEFAATPHEVSQVLQSPAGRHLTYQQVHNNITLLKLAAEIKDIRYTPPKDTTLQLHTHIRRLCDVLEFLITRDCIDVSGTYQK